MPEPSARVVRPSLGRSATPEPTAARAGRPPEPEPEPEPEPRAAEPEREQPEPRARAGAGARPGAELLAENPYGPGRPSRRTTGRCRRATRSRATRRRCCSTRRADASTAARSPTSGSTARSPPRPPASPAGTAVAPRRWTSDGRAATTLTVGRPACARPHGRRRRSMRPDARGAVILGHGHDDTHGSPPSRRTRRVTTPPRWRWSPSAARATRSTPRSSPGGSRPAASASSTQPADAETVVVNTCGFVEAAKKDSVDTLLAAADLKDGAGPTQAVVAVGCLAERYGKDLADVAARGRRGARLRRLPRHGRPAARRSWPASSHEAHTPTDRRLLLPVSPAERGAKVADVVVPGHVIAAPDLDAGLAPASGPRAVRRRLDGGPTAPLKLASGCDRRCSFCAIPSFRGSFVSRRPSDVVGEARWLAEQGVRELFLVSENSTSYGKDLGDLRLLETLLPELAGGRRRRAGAGVLPAARRDPARARRDDREDPGCRGLLRPVVPARLGPRAAPDAPLRRRRQLPRPARPGARAWRRTPVSAPT